MTEEIKPALTAEEWAHGDAGGNSEPWVQINGSLDARATEFGLDIWRDTDYEGCSGHFDRADNRHGLAALCLYGQPFGFTHDDVSTLEEWSRPMANSGNVFAQIEAEHIRQIAAKIAALLPPEKL